MSQYRYIEEDGPLELKDGIDLQDLRDPNKGVEFEVNNEGAEPDCDTSNRFFDGEEVYQSVLRVDDEINETCDREGLEMFEVLLRRMTDVTENKDGGVMKMVLENGAGPKAPHGSLVRVHYNAYKELDDEPFDSTRLRHEIEKFRLGIDGSVAGLHVAVATMRKGERSRFIFKPEYYYGSLGCPPRIPPDCTVLFDIELVSFVEREGVDDYYQLTEDEKRKSTFEFVTRVSKAEREEGNQLFNTQMYAKALSKYRRAARILDDYHLKNEEEEREQQRLLVKIYSNISLCYLRTKQYGHAITFCHKVLDLDPNNVKALFRKGQALHYDSKFDEARVIYRKAQMLDSVNRDITKALTKLDNDIRRFRIQSEDYAKMCQRMMAMSGSDDSPANENRQAAPTGGASESQEVEDKCSEQFRTTVTGKLWEFCRDPDLVEMPFPEQSLTPAEIACILEVADSLQMKVQRKGAGNASRMVVVKRKDQVQFK